MNCVTTSGNGRAETIDTKTVTLAVVPADACEDWMELRNIGLTNLTVAWGVEESFQVEPLSGSQYHAVLLPNDAFSRENFRPGAVRCTGDAVGGKIVFKVEYRLGAV